MKILKATVIDYLKWAKEYPIKIWKENCPAHWGSVNIQHWKYQGPYDGIIGSSGGLSIETYKTEEDIAKHLYGYYLADKKRKEQRAKLEKNPILNTKYSKSQFMLAYIEYCEDNGHSYDEFDRKMAWIDFQKNTKMFNHLKKYLKY